MVNRNLLVVQTKTLRCMQMLYFAVVADWTTLVVRTCLAVGLVPADRATDTTAAMSDTMSSDSD
jgi:hypothetical protein